MKVAMNASRFTTLLAAVACLPAAAAVVATNPTTTVDINSSGSTLTEQVGNVSLNEMNANANVQVLSYEVSEGYSTSGSNPAVDFTPPNTLQTVGVNAITGGGTVNVLSGGANFVSSGTQAVVTNSAVEIKFANVAPVAAVGFMLNRTEVNQTITVQRTGQDDEVFTVGVNGATGHSFFGYTSTSANITRVTISQGSATNYRGFDDVAFSYTPVPEPGSLALLGLGALCVIRRRRG